MNAETGKKTAGADGENTKFLELVVDELARIEEGKFRNAKVRISEHLGGHKYMVEVIGRGRVLEKISFLGNYAYNQAAEYAQKWQDRGLRIEDMTALPKYVLRLMSQAA